MSGSPAAKMPHAKARSARHALMRAARLYARAREGTTPLKIMRIIKQLDRRLGLICICQRYTSATVVTNATKRRYGIPRRFGRWVCSPLWLCRAQQKKKQAGAPRARRAPRVPPRGVAAVWFCFTTPHHQRAVFIRPSQTNRGLVEEP